MTHEALHDVELARRLLLHEARAQLSLGRELRDLGDGWLLHDPADPEPFWNRLIAPTWPVEPSAFDRRLDLAITLFATLGRIAHIRPLPLGNEPPDLVERLVAVGFDRVGADRRMVLVDAAPCLRAVEDWGGDIATRLSVQRWPKGADADPLATAGSTAASAWAGDAAIVLAEAFVVDPIRRVALETDLLACGERPGCSVIVVRDEGTAVAVARRTTVGPGSYLSSIGTRPDRRGRGHGTLVTALAVADALADGSAFVHLAVELDNERGQRFYERLGFRVVGDVVPDLLLR